MFAFLDISDLGLIVEEGPGLGQVLGQADSFMEWGEGVIKVYFEPRTQRLE